MDMEGYLQRRNLQGWQLKTTGSSDWRRIMWEAKVSIGL
jgi:hypothetical protein